MKVLIETYWNVKTDLYKVLDVLYGVLIETYWNVKSGTVTEQRCSVNRINRNILECKGSTGRIFETSSIRRINRNILECKAISEALTV